MSNKMAGCDTPQYLAVQKNQDILETALRGAGAEKSLLTQFKSHGWVDQLANMKADELITNALTKIEIKVENYDVFIEMLRKVKGIKDVVDMIIGSNYFVSLQQIMISVSLHYCRTVSIKVSKR